MKYHYQHSTKLIRFRKNRDTSNPGTKVFMTTLNTGTIHHIHDHEITSIKFLTGLEKTMIELVLIVILLTLQTKCFTQIQL